MKQLITFLILAVSLHAQADSLKEWEPTFFLKTNEPDPSLSVNEAKYTFEFKNLEKSNNIIQYSMDGIAGSIELTKDEFSIIVSPGKHIFQFFYTTFHYEVYTDSLEIEAGFHSTYQVRMDRSDEIQIVDKPVIYLYPEVMTEVEVKIDIVGTPTFYYPAYTDSWTFTALPSGDLIFGDDTYNYLFWESNQQLAFTPSERTNGFNVKGSEVVSFLEEKLTALGFNSKEKADFITYWGPRLAQNALNFVRFEYGEDCCDKYARLSITPEPTTINRVYMSWMAISTVIDLEEQVILPLPRNGFNVLEWGGYEVKNNAPKNTDAVK